MVDTKPTVDENEDSYTVNIGPVMLIFPKELTMRMATWNEGGRTDFVMVSDLLEGKIVEQLCVGDVFYNKTDIRELLSRTGSRGKAPNNAGMQ